ncbi:MAG: AAA family ATPase [Desulfovibrionaceae bacterium]
MIKRIILKDFLVHRHTEIELGPGLTVIAGPNNSGKSAVVEGLRCLAANPVPQYFIRHGAKQARVSAELEDGVVVSWVRTPKYAIYEVLRPGEDEPQVYAKFGRTPPEDVLNLLRLDKVDVDDNPSNAVDVHIGNQREPVFLLDKPGTAAAAFFASSSESAHLLAMQKALKTRVQEAKKEDAFLASRLDGVCADLDAMADLPRTELNVEGAEGELAAIEALQRAIPDLASHVEARLRLARVRQKLAERCGSLAKTQPPPVAAPVALLARLLARLRGLGEEAVGLEARTAAFLRLTNPPRLADAAGLAAAIRTRRSLGGEEGRLAVRGNALSALEAPPKLLETEALAGVLDRLRRSGKRELSLARRQAPLSELGPPPTLAATENLAENLRRRAGLQRERDSFAGSVKALAVLQAPPDLEDLRPLARLMRRLSSLLEEREGLGKRLAAQQQTLENIVDRTARRLAEIGACPTCGQPLDAEAFLRREHGHADS